MRAEAQEVIDENSSPDLLDDDSGINGVRLKPNIIANLSPGNYQHLCSSKSYKTNRIKWWNCYSHCLSKLCLQMNVLTKFWFNEVCSLSDISRMPANIHQPETCFGSSQIIQQALYTSLRALLTCWLRLGMCFRRHIALYIQAHLVSSSFSWYTTSFHSSDEPKYSLCSFRIKIWRTIYFTFGELR